MRLNKPSVADLKFMYALELTMVTRCNTLLCFCLTRPHNRHAGNETHRRQPRFCMAAFGLPSIEANQIERKISGIFDLSDEKAVVMKSRLRPHTVTFGRRKTSISLEDAFWIGLYKIARRKRTTRSKLVWQIARKQHVGNLSSAVRVFVLNQLPLQIKAKR